MASSERTSTGHEAMPRLTVPRTNGSVLRVPDQSAASELLIQNGQRLGESEIPLQGMSLGRLRQWVRAEILDRAADYTGSLTGDGFENPGGGPLIVTGHQPELFHAGVWTKNFAAAGLARQNHGLAVNLIIDNDLLETTSILVPLGTREAPHLELIAFDAARHQQPWEEATVLDLDSLRDFGQRIESLIDQNWHYQPLVTNGWPEAIKQAGHSQKLHDCLTAARVAVERSMGVQNLEIPMSRVCETDPFRWFVAHLLGHLDSFHPIYNEAIREYRRVNRLRSGTHPVPELETRDSWLEAPFWIWKSGALLRDRLFVRRVADELQLRDQQEIITRFPTSADGSAEEAVTALAGLSERGIRLRTRALTTTLFARIFLADLFVHGIGGAKYDVMTDRICDQFYRLAPPQFLTVSATLHLPLGEIWPVAPEDLGRLNHRLRDMTYNPDRHLVSFLEPEAEALVAEKRQLINAFASRRPTALEHREISEINAKLAPFAEPTRILCQQQRLDQKRLLSANSILQNREFSWCLHSEESIRSTLLAEFLR